jgi:HAD superfamily hydrolase (TIGR01484 family)
LVFFAALAADYDGTLAHDGIVDGAIVEALEQFKATGRRLILVTGRELAHLREVFPEFRLFDRIVAENGAVIYDPAADRERAIAPAPPEAFVAALRARKITPLSVGRSIVATWEPHEKAVLETIQQLGLELQIIFNKGAVMVLPAGINKAAGLAGALDDLQLSRHNVAGIGDAENDHAFLAACGCAVAVANALPMIKEKADAVTKEARGLGVIEAMERLVKEDTAMLEPGRHGILIGRAGAEDIVIEPYRGDVLIAGSSGGGKSTVAVALSERMAERGYQFCVLDPEGDYRELENAVSVGDVKAAPRLDEITDLVQRHVANAVINILAIPTGERPAFLTKLLPDLAETSARYCRPHWLIIDEAHHLLPAENHDAPALPTGERPAVIMITVHPEAIARQALHGVKTVIALGPDAMDTVASFCAAAQLPAPAAVAAPGDGEVLLWRAEWPQPRVITLQGPKQVHQRHTRKYAEGELGEDRSFYFRGPNGSLNLRAQNLSIFLQMADGVDEGTWQFHRRQGDYSRWVRDAIKDEDLARQLSSIESDRSLDARESRKQVTEAINARYTTPARAE